MKKSIFTTVLILVFFSWTYAADYFWVGGSGNWNDFAAHWATTSGGTTFHTQVPTSLDNVYFDASSFSSASQTVTINVDAVCADMSWTGVTNNPTLAGAITRKISIYGSFTLVAGMTYNFLGDVYFESLNTDRPLTMAGQSFKRNVYFQGVGGYVFQDTFTQSGNFIVYLVRGSLNFNNQTVNINRLSSDNMNVRNLSFGSSTITISAGTSDALEFNGTNMTLNAGTSLIRFTGANGGMYNPNGGGLAFYDINFEAVTGTSYARNRNGSFHNLVFNSNGIISYTNTINSVTFTGSGTINDNGTNISSVVINGEATINANGTYGSMTLNSNGSFTGSNSIGTLIMSSGKTYTLSVGKTQQITDNLTANGNCAAPITIQSSSSTSGLSKSSGSVTVNYCILQGINASGGAIFTANNTIDFGDNTGWTITAPTPLNLYWVGGTGNWNDPTKWSLSSGGTPGTCIPSALDNVYFDANSFTAASQTVTIIGDGNGKAFCNNMNWSGVTNNPTLAGTNSYTLNIFGSLTLNPGMTYSFNGGVYFSSTSVGNTIFSAGKILDKNHMYFNGAGGGWSLMDGLNLGAKYIYHVNGSFSTNNQPVTISKYYSNYTNTRSLNLGSSIVTITQGSADAMEIIGTNMTLNAGTSLIKFTAANGGISNPTGGGLAFYDVNFEAISGTGYARNRNGSFHNLVFNSAAIISYTNTINDVTVAGNATINDNGTNITTLVVNGDATLNDNSTYGHVTLNGNGAITGNNTFGTLIFTAGKQYTLTSNKTQTITNDLIANGTETQLIIIKSSTVGTQSNISKASGTVMVESVTLRDNNAIGGAIFIANNSIDLGNNSGWTIIAPGGKDYYWVGGTGNWNDASKWALSSGGAGGAGIPTSIDNVYFDANSFSAPGQIVTVIGDASNNASFINMDWTGVTNNPTFAGASTQNLRIYGSLTFSPNMIFTFAGLIYFEATDAGHTVFSGGLILDKNNMHFQGEAGAWTLLDGLNLGNKTLNLTKGSLSTNNQPLTLAYFKSYNSNIRSLNLGNSIITISNGNHDAMEINGTNLTMDAGTSLIRFTGVNGGMYNPTGGGLNFYDVNFEAVTGTGYARNRNGSFHNIVFNSLGNISFTNTINSVIFTGNGIINDNGNNIATIVFNGDADIAGNSTFGHVTMNGNGIITGNNTFGTLILTAGNEYTLTNGRTQTITTDLIANGTETQLIIIKSSSSGSVSTLSKASGTVLVNYVSLKDNAATGGASFVANNSIDLGNTPGWVIIAPGPKDYYWVGDAGNWNDPAHWSLSSGGPGSAGLPTSIDNVFFDANSFSVPGQTVTLIGDASSNINCLNMDWTNVSNNPILAGANTQNLRIYGSLTLSPNMTFNFSGPIYFEATELGKTIFTGGLTLNKNDMYLQGVGGGWTLLDGLNLGNKYLYFIRGLFNTNNQPLTLESFYSSYSNSRSLNLGTSVISISRAAHDALYFNGTNMTLDAGTSLIKFTSANGGMYNPNGGGLNFYDVICEAATGTGYVRNANGSFNNIVFNSAGIISFTNTINSVTFEGEATINDNGNIIGSAIFNGNGTITGNNTFGDMILSPGITFTITANRTQVITNQLVAEGTCSAPITIQSSSLITQTTISKSTGTVEVNQVSLQGINATGGASFIAHNAIDLGNNSGWSFAPAGNQNLYWVGGTGNWNDVNHWAAESGGAGGYCLPTQLDNVFFDANSFTQTGQAVYVDIANPACKDMNWSLASFEPTFTSLSNTYELRIYGSLVLSPDMNFAFSGDVIFEGGDPGKAFYSITTAGNTFNSEVYFNGDGGVWVLQDDFNAGNNDLYFNKGTLNSNNRTVTCHQFNSSTNNNRVLIMGSSLFVIGDNLWDAWYVTGSNFTLDAGSSEIRLTAASTDFLSNTANTLIYNVVTFINPGGQASLTSDDSFNSVTFNASGIIDGSGNYTDVIFYGDGEIDGNNTFGHVSLLNDGNISGANTFNTLALTSGKTYLFEAGQTQTINSDLTFWGSDGNLITIQSLTAGSQATLSKALGTVSGNYIILKDMNATGGATFNVYNSENQGNNTGWNFLEPPFATCPDNFDLCVNATPIVLNQALPTGWDYSGEGVYYNNIDHVYMFDPSLVSGSQSLITYTIGGLFPGSCNFTITIRPLPVAECPENIVVCEGSDYITLYEGVGEFSLDGGMITGFDPVTPGIYTIEFTLTNSCGENSCEFTIEVKPLPTVNISGDLDICLGESTTLTATEGTSYLWNTGATTQTIEVTVTGTYSVEVTGANGCKSTAQVTVTVHPLPVITISGDTEFCDYESSLLTATEGSSYLWNTGATTQSITVTTEGLYSVVVTDIHGCEGSAQVPVIVHPAPAIVISGDTEICLGESTLLTATEGSSYLWSTGATTQSITVSTGGTYSVVVTDINGCEGSASNGVTVHPLPVINITGDLAFCEGQSTILTATEGSSYQWSSGQDTRSITVLIAGDYSVVVTDANGCEGSDEVTTTYLPVTVPTCPGNMNALVTDSPFALSGGMPEGGTYSGVGVSGNIFSPGVAGIGTFPVTYLIDDVCGPQSCEFTITVSEEPITCENAVITNFPVSASDACENDTYSINFTGVVIENAVQIIWTVDPVEAGTLESNVFILNAGYVGPVNITLLAVAEDPCLDDQESVGFVVNPLPTFSHQISDTEICAGDEVTFTDQFTGTAPWTVQILEDGITYSFTTYDSQIQNTDTYTETTTYEIVSVTDGNGCIAMINQVVTITVYPLPGFTYELSDTEICAGEEVIFTDHFTGTAPWTVELFKNGIPQSFTSTGELLIHPIILQETTVFEILTVTDGNGCISTLNESVTVTVHPLPTYSYELSATEVCYGETVNFVNHFTGTPPWIVVYEYNGVQSSFTTSDNPDYYSEIFYETTVNEIISITDGNGCTSYLNDITTITVYPLPEIEITGDLAFCEGQSTILTATEGSSYQWSSGQDTRSITVLIAGDYSVVVTDANGCEGSAQVTTSYLPVTIPTCPGNMNALVTDSPFALSGGMPEGGTYSGVGVSGNIFSPGVAGIGTFPVTYLIDDVCGPQSCEFTITVSEEPITCENAVITNFPASAEDACENEIYSIDFSAVTVENAVEQLWTIDPVEAGSITDEIFNLNPGYVGSVSITLAAYAADPCLDDMATVNFTVNPLPVIDCPVYGPYCQGDDPITFTESGTFTFNDLPITGFNPETAGSFTIIYSETNIYGCESNCEFAIEVKPIPVVTCPVDLEVCINSSPLTLTGATPAGGIYSGSGVSNGQFDPNTAGEGSHAITYTYVEQKAALWTFEGDVITPAFGTGSASLLPGTTATFATGNGGGRGWNTSTYPAQGAGSGTRGIQFLVPTSGFTGIHLSFDQRASGTASRWAQVQYTIDGTNWLILANNSGGISPYDTFIPFSFDFSAIPEADNNPNFGIRIVSIFSPVAFSDGLGNNFEANQAYHRARETGGSVYGPSGTWRFDNVKVSGTPVFGCETSCQFNILVNPLPVVEITGDLEFCMGESSVLTATPGESYLWSTTEISQSITVSESGTYSVLVTDENGCQGSAEVNVTVHPLPTFNYEISDTEVCFGDEVTFTNHFAGTPPWTVDFMYNGIQSSFTTYENPEYFTDVFTETTVYENLLVTDGTGCSSVLDQIVTITVHPLPIIEIEGETAFCEGGSTILTATEGISYLWNTGETSQSITVDASGMYSVVVTDANGCDGSAQVTVIENQPPQLNCPATMQAYNTDLPIKLEAVTPLGGVYTGQGITFDGTDYYFDPSIGVGTYPITYCFTSLQTNCTNCCTFDFVVSEQSGNAHVICIRQGWSGISTYLDPYDPSLNSIFANLNAQSKVGLMLSETGIYWPGQNVNTIGSWDVLKGYKIKMNSTGCITIDGEMPVDKIITANKGISYIPVLCDQPVLAADIFNQFGNNLQFAFDIYSQLVYWPQGHVYSLEYLEPGVGYMVKMTTQTSAVFNCTKSSPENYIKAEPTTYENAPWNYVKSGSQHFISINPDLYMSMQAGDYIGVFDNQGNCAGLTQFTGNPGNLLLIAYGDDFTTDKVDGLTQGEAMNFRLYRPSQRIETELHVEFDHSLPDAGVFADLGQSMIIKMQEGSTSIDEIMTSSVKIHPNPGQGIFNLSIHSSSQLIDIMVLTSSGQAILSESIALAGIQTNHQLDLTGVKPGVYYIRITDKHQTMIKKVVVNQ